MSSRLKELRLARDLRREDLASRTKVSYQYIRKLETTDDHVPTLRVARAIADVLGVTVDEVWPPEAHQPDPDGAAA